MTLTRVVKRKTQNQRQQRYVTTEGKTAERAAISHSIVLVDPEHPDSGKGAINMTTWDADLAARFATLDVVTISSEKPQFPQRPDQKAHLCDQDHRGEGRR